MDKTNMNNSSKSDNLLFEILNQMPHLIIVYDSVGKPVFVNKAWINMFCIDNIEDLMDKYNIHDDQDMKKWGYYKYVQQAYEGKTVELHNIKVPIREMINKYGDRKVNTQVIFQSILSYPVYLNDSIKPYIVVMFITTDQFAGREEVLLGKKYIEDYWMDEFDIDKAAKAAYLSRYYFTRIFKQHIGMSPYEYYKNIKIEMLKKKLADTDISIVESFSACGMNYTGSSITFFKKKVGMTPSEYRNLIIKG